MLFLDCYLVDFFGKFLILKATSNQASKGNLLQRLRTTDLRKLCDARIPPLMSETSKPPTPMAETLYSLIMIPFSLLCNDNSQFCNNVLQNLTENFLSHEFSEQVDYFIIPALSQEKSFPYGLWNKVLNQNESTKTPWLLYSFLKLGTLRPISV